MLSVQGQVVGELVDQHPSHEAHLRAAAFDHAHWGGSAHDRLARAQLDHRPAVLEHHVAARALREPVAVLVADDFELIGRKPRGLRCRQLDSLHRHTRLVEEGHGLIAGLGLLRSNAARVRGNDVLLLWCLRLPLVDELSQVQLRAGALDDAPLALLSEQLALEPLQLVFEQIDLVLRRRQLPAQTHHLLRCELSGFLQAQHARSGRRIHGRNYTICITVAVCLRCAV